MKIAVCIKQAPARDSLLRINTAGSWIQEDDLSFEINEPDAYALEAALQLKEQNRSRQGTVNEVVVLTVGPPRAAQTIREALAKGADRAIQIEQTDNLLPADPLFLACLLAKAVEPEKPDLILTGLQSDDLGYGQTGVILAELLGLPHATIIMQVDLKDQSIRIKRELEDGWFQHVEMPLPALLTIQSGISKLRYATLMGIKKAKTKEIKRLSAADLGVAAAHAIETSRLYAPGRAKQAQIFEGNPKEAAARLVEKLKFEARVL